MSHLARCACPCASQSQSFLSTSAKFVGFNIQSLMEGPYNPGGSICHDNSRLSWLTSLACILCNMLCTSRSRITPRSPQSNTCLLLYKDEQCAHNNCWHHTYCVDVNICCHISTFAFLAASQGRQCGWTADWALSHAT